MATTKRQRKKENHEARRAALEAARKRQQRKRQVLNLGGLGLGVLLLALVRVFVAGRGGEDDDGAAATTSTTAAEDPAEELATAPPVPAGRTITGDTPCPKPTGEARASKFEKAPPTCIDPAKAYRAVFTTSAGVIKAALDTKRTPKTVNNFVFLARYHYYEGVIFHRIIRGFMCQGGDPTGTGRGGPGYQFADELPKPGRYQIGSVAMANAGPNTNGSQFFLISGQQGVRLPPQYALFGQVVTGLDVLEAMQNVPVGGQDRPKDPVTITSVTISEHDG